MIEVIKERSAEQGPLLEDEEQILGKFVDVQVFFNSCESSPGPGVLFITSRKVAWFSTVQSLAFAVDFHSISIHAISRDQQFFPYPCLYCQLDIGEENQEEETEEDEEEIHAKNQKDFTLGEQQLTELRFVPQDAAKLDKLFAAFSQGASLNPDPFEEGEGDFMYNAEELQTNNLSTEGQNNLLHYENLFQITSPATLDSLLEEDDENFMGDENYEAEHDQDHK
eukprot:TRINITY_DN1465_c0_g1_i1.p1 TRINITY_DN1465_c0_g1~~TRINITY_DN1465_c0_g1_i1.p1  ORF type:complete len:224 (-),score=51.18 TRINITY_DN1465_c0_g1_i1:623-1294(-)